MGDCGLVVRRLFTIPECWQRMRSGVCGQHTGAHPPKVQNVQVLDFVDGTGVANGDIELQKVLNIVTDACALLVAVNRRAGGLPQWCTQKRHLGLHDFDSAYSLVGV